jgi:hypothetical protein
MNKNCLILLGLFLLSGKNAKLLKIDDGSRATMDTVKSTITSNIPGKEQNNIQQGSDKNDRDDSKIRKRDKSGSKKYRKKSRHDSKGKKRNPDDCRDDSKIRKRDKSGSKKYRKKSRHDSKGKKSNPDEDRDDSKIRKRDKSGSKKYRKKSRHDSKGKKKTPDDCRDDNCEIKNQDGKKDKDDGYNLGIKIRQHQQQDDFDEIINKINEKKSKRNYGHQDWNLRPIKWKNEEKSEEKDLWGQDELQEIDESSIHNTVNSEV